MKVVTIDSKGLMSLDAINGLTLEVIETKEVEFSSGVKKYFIVQHEKKSYEVREDFCK